MAVMLDDHVHRPAARAWMSSVDSNIAFIRVTALSVLRLMTTRTVMNGKPLSMDGAWQVYDQLFKDDDRITLISEPPGVENLFRKYAAGPSFSPKLWADAWLLAFAEAAGGTVITFDRGLATRGAHCLVTQGT
jgi:predicted nucleic acid-binding protein